MKRNNIDGYPVTLYVGFDVHQATTAIAVHDSAGKLLSQSTTQTSSQQSAISSEVSRAPSILDAASLDATSADSSFPCPNLCFNVSEKTVETDVTKPEREVLKASSYKMADNAIKKQSILFQNDNEAVAVFPSAASKAEDIVRALDIKPYKAIILVLGGAAGVDEKLIPRLTQLFGRGTARAAAQANAIIIDGGTQSGVMAMMGEGVAARGYKSMLVGVAPASKVTYPGNSATGVSLEPNHSHFVLVEGSDWGSETATIYKLISVLTSKGTEAANAERNLPKQDSETSKVPGLAILAGGGPISRDEVLRAVRHNLPLSSSKAAAGWQMTFQRRGNRGRRCRTIRRWRRSLRMAIFTFTY